MRVEFSGLAAFSLVKNAQILLNVHRPPYAAALLKKFQMHALQNQSNRLGVGSRVAISEGYGVPPYGKTTA